MQADGGLAMIDTPRSIATKVIHAGEPEPRLSRAVTMPIFQTSTYLYEGETDYHDVKYARLNNSPNHAVLSDKLAAISGSESALVAASGMAAISTTLLSVLSGGDHLIAIDCLYGGTHTFVTKNLPRFGIEHTLVETTNVDSWHTALRPNSKALYVEAMTNPTLRVPDLRRAVAFAREHGLVTLIDCTFAPPGLLQPHELGFELVLHSATKYLNGHDDLIAGVVTGSAERVATAKRLLDHLGGCLDPHACFLLQRGIKTLAVRLRAQCQSAMKIAAFLEGHPKVKYVYYPGLESHPQYAFAQSLYDGYGGMIGFELHGGAKAGDEFTRRCDLLLLAVSLGGVDSLVIRPAAGVHVNVAEEDRDAAGISDGLIRLSVGLEDSDDLIADMAQALR